MGDTGDIFFWLLAGFLIYLSFSAGYSMYKMKQEDKKGILKKMTDYKNKKK